MLKESIDPGCICAGNWRNIVSREEPRINKLFHCEHEAWGKNPWRFFGVVHGGDDYYYGMVDSDGKASLLSCVGGIEQWGYREIT